MMNGADFSWTREPRLRRIMAALGAAGEARFVGGCVRDALLGRSPLTDDAIDIDIATTLTPKEMRKAFGAAGIRSIATGEDHGTLTAVEDGLVAECTTLRADEVTDGRHAEVRFTRDWEEDWRRRDFTINALYADEGGALWDPAGGLSDLQAGRVRFIGRAADRIREDALRILRFFRFSARFAESFDDAAVEAIEAHTDLLDILSRERVWSELSRTFAAKRAPEALVEAARLGVLATLVPGEARTAVFARLHNQGEPTAALAVAALWPGRPVAELKSAFKPSAAFLDQYAAIGKARAAIAGGTRPHELLYRFGREAAVGAVRLAEAEGAMIAPAFRSAVGEDPVPVLPVSGKDIVSRGIEPGPRVGKAVAAFETRWLEEGAPTDETAVSRLLDEALGGEPPR